MLTIGIAEISKNPALFNSDEIMDIVDKKSKVEKYIAIPAKYRMLIEDAIMEIEYRQWLENNENALKKGSGETVDAAVFGDRLEHL